MSEAKLKLSIDGVQNVVGSLGKVQDKMGGVARSAAALLGGALSAGAFAGFVKGAIDSADASSKLSQSTGVAVKDLAGLQLAYRQAGLEGSALQQSMAKLSAGIVNGSDALDALGINAKTATGGFRSTKDVLYDVADALKGLPDGAHKSALAMKLFGEDVGTKLIPLLNGGSAGMRQMEDMATRLGLSLSEKTAREAESFNDTMDLMGQGTQGVARTIAADLLPTMTSIAASFLESMTAGDRLQNIAAALGATLKGLYSIAVGVVEVFSTVGKVLGGVAAAAVASLSGDFSLAKSILGEMVSDIGAGWADSARAISRAWTTEGNAAIAAQAAILAGGRDLLSNAKERERANSAAAKAAKSELDAHMKTAQARSAARNAEYAEIDDYLRGEENARTAAVKAANDAVIAAQEEYDHYGKTRSQIAEVTLARLQGKLAAVDAGSAIAKSIEDEIDAQRRLIGVLRRTEVRDTDLQERNRALEEGEKRLEHFRDRVQDTLGGGLYEMLNGDFKSIGDSFKRMILKMEADALAANIMGALNGKGGGSLGFFGTAFKFLGSLGGSAATSASYLSDADLAGGLIPPTMFNALGNAFDNGSVVPFANGGAFTNSITDRPTLAPMALFGEAGPEAIMPLSRGPDGALGVAAHGALGARGGRSVTVSPKYIINIDSRADRAAIQHDMNRVKDATTAEIFETLRREGVM